MKRYKMKIACLILLCSMYFSGIASAKEAQYLSVPEIRVGLWTKQASIYVSAEVPFVIRHLDDQKIIGKYDANTKLFVTVKNDAIMINNKKVKTDRLLVVLEKQADDQGIEVNKKKYRGVIELINQKKVGLTAINIVPIEQYLYSIVPGEMPASWAMEAVKAQAVAARTFVLNSLNKHEREGYQVCATTHCQVYGGKTAELERSTKAVKDTNGLVMLYQGKPITAVFHSSSGGYTENSEDVWGTYSPYLRSVFDYDEGLPQYQWEKKMTPREMQDKLKAMGYAIGNLQAIELSPLCRNGQNTGDRSARGRIKSIRFIGDQGNVLLTGTQVRSVLSLNSTWFDIQLIIPTDKKIDVPIGIYYKKNIDVDLPPYQEKGLLTDKVNTRRITGSSGETIVLNGYGWGHGLGLSQWGAKAMASKVPETEVTYFKEILKHYYQGIEIKKLY